MGEKLGGTSGQGARQAIVSRPGVLLGFLVALSVSLPPIALPVGGAPASTWGTAELIETDNTDDAQIPQVAIDASGNAVAVWRQHDGSRWNIWSNRYVVGSGWATAQLIETDNAGHTYPPQVALDASGSAVAVWRQSDGTRSNIWANRYAAGSGWGTAQLIETDNAGDARNPQVAVDWSGNAVAVWEQSDGIRYNIWANRYAAESGWGAAQLIDTDNAADAYTSHVAIDASGNAVAVWHQSDGTRYNIWANRYAAGSGWGTAQLIETDNAGDAGFPQVAVDASGNAVAVWFQSNGTRYNIWANRYAVGSGWGTPELIETDNAGDAAFPQVAVDASGNAVAVWHQHDGPYSNIWANRFVVGSGWGTAELIETDDAGGASYPQVAVNASGNATAVWSQSGNILANRFVVGSGWGTAELIETDDTGGAGAPQVAVDPSGNAVAVWQQSDGTRNNIWANRYIAPDVAPPVPDAGTDFEAVAGELVWFNGTATDNDPTFPSGATWRWTVDVAGTTIVLEGQERTYSFAESGVYTVTLSVSDYSGNIGKDTLTVTVVEPDTEAPLVPRPPDIDALVGDPVTFHANATDDSADFDLTGNISWRFTGGGEQVTLYGQDVTHTFDRAGVFAASLAVLDGSGNRAPVRTFTVRVTVLDVTPPDVTASADRTDVTVGTRVTLVGSATDAGVGFIDDALFEWRFSYDGSVKTLAGHSPSFVFEREGTYVVELSVRDANGNVGTASVTVTVREASPATVGSGVDALLVGGLLAAVAAAAVAAVFMRGRKRAGRSVSRGSGAGRAPRGGSSRSPQPRRVAARSLEVRRSDEMGAEDPTRDRRPRV